MDYETPFIARCTGAEFIEFFSDSSIWPEGRYIDQMDCWINDEELPQGMQLSSIPLNAVIEFSDQCKVWEDDPNFLSVDLVTYFNAWRLAKQSVTIG